MRVQAVLLAIGRLLYLIGVMALGVVMLWSVTAIIPFSSKPIKIEIVLFGWLCLVITDICCICILRRKGTGLFGRMLRIAMVVASGLIHCLLLLSGLFLMLLNLDCMDGFLYNVLVVAFPITVLVLAYRMVRSA